MHLPKPTWVMFGWRPYELSCSKSPPALSKALATCGSISLRAGQDAICSWRSGKNLKACPSLHRVKFCSLPLNLAPDAHPTDKTSKCFPKTRFSLAQRALDCSFSSPGLGTLKKSHALKIPSD